MNKTQTPEQINGPESVPSFEKKIIASILTRIRENRRTPSSKDIAPGFQSVEGLPPAQIREAALSDCTAVTELKRRWGLIPDTFENWQKLWVRNPALEQAGPHRPLGWVLEAAGAVVGYLGNISSTYSYGDKTLTAVTAHGLVVEPSYRATSLTLSAAFFRQTSVDLLLGTTAIEAVGKLSLAFRSNPLPQPDYDTVLFWVLRTPLFARSVARKLRLRPVLAYCASTVGSLAVAADKLIRRRWPRGSTRNLDVKRIEVREIGGDFETLWKAKRDEGLLLLADRRPSTLRWHFDIPGDRATTSVFCCYDNQALVGYLVIRHEPNPGDSPRRSVVCDMIALSNRSDIVRALFVAAYDEAKRAGSHILEVIGFPSKIRKVLLRWNPYQRKFPACPFYYKAVDPSFHDELSNEAVWFASPYDGDTTLMP